jgi:D-alanine-D-alanine ligase
LYNQPSLTPENPDWASEAGVLESVAAVGEALQARGHRSQVLAVESLPQFLDALASLPQFDVAVNLFEGLAGVGRGESEITGLCELAGLRLTGSPAECLGLVRDKARTKWLLAGAGIATPPFAWIDVNDRIDQGCLSQLLSTGPLIVKPAHEDGSLGIGLESVVRDFAALERQIHRIRERYGPVMVERFIVGREFNAAIIALPTTELLPLAEIEFRGPGPAGWQMVTYEAKWAAGSEADRATPACCPAQVDADTAAKIGHAALAAFRVAGCRDYARVDLRMDDQGRLYVLEVNGNPDIGPTAGFARSLRAAGMAYADFVERLVQTASERHAGKPIIDAHSPV